MLAHSCPMPQVSYKNHRHSVHNPLAQASHVWCVHAVTHWHRQATPRHAAHRCPPLPPSMPPSTTLDAPRHLALCHPDSAPPGMITCAAMHPTHPVHLTHPAHPAHPTYPTQPDTACTPCTPYIPYTPCDLCTHNDIRPLYPAPLLCTAPSCCALLVQLQVALPMEAILAAPPLLGDMHGGVYDMHVCAHGGHPISTSTAR